MEKKHVDIELAEVQNEREQEKADIKLYKEQQENRISKGYFWMEGDKIPVKRRSIRDLFSMVLPKNFEIMKEKQIEMKYPSLSSKDDYMILTNDETTVNIVFLFSKLQLKEEEHKAARDEILEIFKKLNPSITIEEVGEVGKEPEIAYFSYISPGLDSNLYNLSFIFSAKSIFIKGSFNCGEYEKDDWKDIIKQMIESIQPNE